VGQGEGETWTDTLPTGEIPRARIPRVRARTGDLPAAALDNQRLIRRRGVGARGALPGCMAPRGEGSASTLHRPCNRRPEEWRRGELMPPMRPTGSAWMCTMPSSRVPRTQHLNLGIVDEPECGSGFQCSPSRRVRNFVFRALALQRWVLFERAREH